MMNVLLDRRIIYAVSVCNTSRQNPRFALLVGLALEYASLIWLTIVFRAGGLMYFLGHAGVWRSFQANVLLG